MSADGLQYLRCMIKFVQQLIDEGFNPIPLNLDKSPALSKGHGFLYKPIDNIDKRFSGIQKLGIVCGAISNGFECIDFDAHKGEDVNTVFEAWAQDEGVNILLNEYELPIYRTPRGGVHVYYRCDTPEGTKKLATYQDGSTMIEVLSTGHYVCTAPSEGYKQLSGVEFVKMPRINEDERDYLLNHARTFTQSAIAVQNTNQAAPLRKWPERFDTSTNQGRYKMEGLADFIMMLEAHGWKTTPRAGGKFAFTRPDKDKGTSATFGELPNMFYVFTTNSPFEERKAYNLFDAMCVLKFQGNYKKALVYVDGLFGIKVKEEEPEPAITFPLNVFPKFIEEYILELNHTQNFSRDFLAVSFMFTCSVLNGNKFKLKVKETWVAPTIFWFAAVGAPGTMKTHPVSHMIEPLKRIDKANKLVYDDQMKEFKANEEKGNKPRFKQHLIVNSTLEAVHDVHDFNKKGLGLYKDELAGFIHDMNKYRSGKGSDEEFWLESFNNSYHTINRVSAEPKMLSKICISVIGTIQHAPLAKIAKDHNGNGLIDRFLFTAPEMQYHYMNTFDVNPQMVHAYAEHMTNIVSYFSYTDEQDTVYFTLSKAALDEFISIDKMLVDIQKSENETMAIINYASKMKTYVPRFALLCKVMDIIIDDTSLNELVEIGHMKRARLLTEYFLNTARALFNETDTRVDAQEQTKRMNGQTKPDKIRELAKNGVKNKVIAELCNCSKGYVSRILNA